MAKIQSNDRFGIKDMNWQTKLFLYIKKQKIYYIDMIWKGCH